MEVTSTEIKEHFKKLRDDSEYMTMGSVIVQIEKLEKEKEMEKADKELDSAIKTLESLKGKYNHVIVHDEGKPFKNDIVGCNWKDSRCLLVEYRKR